MKMNIYKLCVMNPQNTPHTVTKTICTCVVCFPVDMIPENALEEMTKNMDPNLVIVEAKDGVQMK